MNNASDCVSFPVRFDITLAAKSESGKSTDEHGGERRVSGSRKHLSVDGIQSPHLCSTPCELTLSMQHVPASLQGSDTLQTGLWG